MIAFRCLLSLAIALMAISGCGGATGAKTETAQPGAVKAALTFNQSRDQVYSNLRLKITRSGQVLYDKPVPSCTGCSPEKVDPVRVRDIEATGEPDVILSLFSGGANCCQVDQVFSLDRRTSTYVESDRDFGQGATIKDLGHDGHLEFVSTNDAFRYKFAPGASWDVPIQIFSFRDRRFYDVTRNYPSLVAADAASWLAAFRRTSSDHYQDSVGTIAPWAADEDLLGHSQLVSSFLAQEEKAGHLNGTDTLAWPGGEKFVATLQRFLRQQGYAPPTTTTTTTPPDSQFTVWPDGRIGDPVIDRATIADVRGVWGRGVQRDTKPYTLGYGCAGAQCATTFEFSNGHLTDFATTDRRFHTPGGAAVGMSERQARRLEPAAVDPTGSEPGPVLRSTRAILSLSVGQGSLIDGIGLNSLRDSQLID